MPIRKIKVMIVDDSIFFRRALQQALSEDQYIDVVASAGSANEAEKLLKDVRPDVMTLDVEMPGRKGPDFLKDLMARNPIPVVLVSSMNMSVFEALQMGAIDFVKKPDMSRKNDYSGFISELAVKVKIASSANMGNKVSVAAATKNAGGTLTLSSSSSSSMVVAIGASTGGTEATLAILERLPSNFPPVVITQHMPPGFTTMYADRLNRICKVRVCEGQDKMRLEPGLAIVAAGDKHMTVERDIRGYYIKCFEGEKVSGHCPSVDVLFESMARTVPARDSIGVILTGMGRDGAAGMLKMHQKGAFTIGQSKETCVVYGMPMEAYKLGAVSQEMPLLNIPAALIKRISGK